MAAISETFKESFWPGFWSNLTADVVFALIVAAVALFKGRKIVESMAKLIITHVKVEESLEQENEGDQNQQNKYGTNNQTNIAHVENYVTLQGEAAREFIKKNQ